MQKSTINSTVSSRLRRWEERFLPRLKKIHGHRSKTVFHRLMKKSSTLRSSLKRRSKEYEVIFEISLEEVRDILYQVYGKQCRYCNEVLKVTNMVCDHIHPLSHGGDSVKENLQIICSRCNTRKGPLTHKHYIKLLKWLLEQQEDLKDYVLRKLARSDSFFRN